MTKKAISVVGIGASAGGLEAVQQLFDHLPNDTGHAFVVIQHLSPDFKSLMPELLSKHTEMEIFTAEDKQEIKANCIYLNQRNKNLHIKENRLYLLEKGPKHNLNLPIDIFFHTLGEEYGNQSIGVILSGTGSDGSRGIETIHQTGGTVIAQDPNSAQFNGMPNSAIATNLCDFILPPDKIANEIVKKNSGVAFVHVDEEETSEENTIEKILLELYRSFGTDFRVYKKNTIVRRLKKRIKQFNYKNLNEYYAFLKSNKNERSSLKKDILIGVTSFFRDAEAFEKLENVIIPSLYERLPSSLPLRIWVPGCSTGEEAYSIVILLEEYKQKHNLNRKYQVFASDVNESVIEKASQSTYNEDEIEGLKTNILHKYFIANGDKYTVMPAIRENIVFSVHDVLRDPPFIRLDFISCRNLLIYLESNAQHKVLYNFQFALNTSGYLFLGNSESLGILSPSFETINSKWKIFKRTNSEAILPKHTTPLPKAIERISKTRSQKRTHYRFKDSPERAYHSYLSEKFSPAAVFIDNDYNVLYIHGNVKEKLHLTEGVFQSNILKLVSPNVAAAIRTGIDTAKVKKEDVLIKNVQNTNDKQTSFDLSFHNCIEKEDIPAAFIIYFGEDKKTETDIPVFEVNQLSEASEQHLELIENELASTKLELQNVIEELETSNEELQSSNEELMASNEEMQSTNEELQSVNEELYTVNSELQEINKQSEWVNDNLNNLINSTELGTLFLDSDLNIKQFTPAVKSLYQFNESDIGRPLSNFASSFNSNLTDLLIENVKKINRKPQNIEQEISNSKNQHFVIRLTPFVTSAKVITGVVITFIDVSARKNAELASQLNEKRLIETQNLALMGSFDYSFNDDSTWWSEMAFKIWGFPVKGTPPKYDVFIKQVHKPDATRLNDLVKRAEQFGENFELSYKYFMPKNKEVKHLAVNAFVSFDSENKPIGLIGYIQDVTSRKLLELEKEKISSIMNEMEQIANVGGWELEIDTMTAYYSNQTKRIYGIPLDQDPPAGIEGMKFYSKSAQPIIQKAVENAISKGESYDLTLPFINAQNQKLWVRTQGRAIKRNGKVIKLYGTFQNITEQKKKELELTIAKQKAESSNIYKNQFLANMSHDIRTPMNAIIGFADLLNDKNLSDTDRSKYIDIIKSSSNRLLNLVNDIVDVSKIEAGELKMHEGSCNVPRIIETICATFNEIKKQQEKEHIEIKTKIPKKHQNFIIKTDEHRVQQILENLVSNALKYSEKGTIEIGFEVKNKQLSCYVKDQGIGIAKQHQDRIFKRFAQLEETVQSRVKGTGLGLAIVKGILDILHGTITVESEEGKGSIFTFTIPFQEIEPAAQSDKAKATLISQLNIDDVCILFVEDDPINERLFQYMFKDHQNIYYAENGKEAVEKYKAHPEIDIVLMDISMPVMDGEEAAQLILEYNPNAKIIAQTAYAMSDDPEKYIRLGFADYLSKPLNKIELIKKIVLHSPKKQ